jgi:peptide/nickel transport system permease protein
MDTVALDVTATEGIDVSRRLQMSKTQLAVRIFGFGALGLLIVCAIAAPWVAPHDPIKTSFYSTLSGPSAEHWLGTDNLGRDVLSRLIFGARTSLYAAAVAVILAAGIGVIPGMAAGYFRGVTEAVIMRVADTIMAFPSLILAIAIVGVLGPNLTNAMIAVGILVAPRFLRLMRGVTMAIRNQPYIEAAQLAGRSHLQILFGHVLPNTLSPLSIQLAFTAGVAILAESSLSFVGLGAQAPTPSWGSMVASAIPFMERTPLLIFAPGAVIALAVLSFNIIGDTIRESWGKEL